jgi:hypothetical protein
MLDHAAVDRQPLFIFLLVERGLVIVMVDEGLRTFVGGMVDARATLVKQRAALVASTDPVDDGARRVTKWSDRLGNT